MKSKTDTQVLDLLDSFADGTISQDDFIQLKAWITESECHREKARRQLQLCAALKVESGDPDVDLEAAIDRFHSYIGEKKARLGLGCRRCGYPACCIPAICRLSGRL